ncbi:MAG: 16S rRNA (guanine(527)-N(7))-methyltransferase RsmG [Lachnospiraceae bacterium]|nr:16S rRNA (guanine(527)-N(7))-methyltransferase RsmG [Lachnospiraceae bacterium]
MNEKYDLSNFKKIVNDLGLNLTDEQYEQFIKYYELLVKWNEVMNLTAITEYDEVIVKHFADSLSLIKAIDKEVLVRGSFKEGGSKITVIDIGTGAGFPGIPLKIAFPNLQITLLDSLNKRVGFLNNVIEELGLKGIDALHGRAEDYAKKGQLRESFDVCVSRAVANLSTLSEYCLPYVKVGGCFIAYKSEKTAQEVDAAQNALDKLGGKLISCEEFNLPGTDLFRTMVKINKEKTTPGKYPRKAGTPSKEPL